MRGNLQQILAENASGDQRIFSICPVDEDEILTEVGLVPQAEEALIARSRICRYHAHTGPESVLHGSANFVHYAGHFMTEDRRGHDHPSVVTLLPYLEISSAGQSHLHADQ